MLIMPIISRSAPACTHACLLSSSMRAMISMHARMLIIIGMIMIGMISMHKLACMHAMHLAVV